MGPCASKQKERSHSSELECKQLAKGAATTGKLTPALPANAPGETPRRTARATVKPHFCADLLDEDGKKADGRSGTRAADVDKTKDGKLILRGKTREGVDFHYDFDEEKHLFISHPDGKTFRHDNVKGKHILRELGPKGNFKIRGERRDFPDESCFPGHEGHGDHPAHTYTRRQDGVYISDTDGQYFRLVEDRLIEVWEHGGRKKAGEERVRPRPEAVVEQAPSTSSTTASTPSRAGIDLAKTPAVKAAKEDAANGQAQSECTPKPKQTLTAKQMADLKAHGLILKGQYKDGTPYEYTFDEVRHIFTSPDGKEYRHDCVRGVHLLREIGPKGNFKIRGERKEFPDEDAFPGMHANGDGHDDVGAAEETQVPNDDAGQEAEQEDDPPSGHT